MSTDANDPAALDEGLTPEESRELFDAAASAAGAELVTSSLRSVHRRPGRSLSEVHEATLRIEGTERRVLLVSHIDTRTLPEGTFVLGRGPVRVAVWRFPHDPFLPGLPSAIDVDRVRELLDRLGAVEGAVRVHTRAYRPSRRAVVEVRIDGDEAAGRILYLKVLSGPRAPELAATHRALAPHVPVPRVVGVADAQGILALEALPGRTLREAMVHGAARPEPGEVVEVSQRLAASGFVGARDPRAFADPRRHVATLARLVPERADDLQRVAAEAAAVDGPTVCVHGDLHDGQLLLDDDGRITGLLDVDGTGPGSLAQDAGSLVAHLEVLGEIWPERAADADDYAAAVADAYRPLVGADALARATAGAWIGLATGPHRAQDHDWQSRTHRRIDRAVEILADR